ncbi:DMT family transporter [Gordonia insulae]|uniref:EamA domain-containing protein n=1 Tax=Gordonia insulae TaxID=2420509 RepID=A0A3G8JRK9_9ACTN|nr:DMT family transporter [Gordonia insulae]AZG47112.1 hypothetical protein D7316_03720 [Gordonia insulae]
MQTSPIGKTRGSWVTALLGTLFVVCWSSGFIGAKLGAADAPVTTVLMWRFVPIALALTLVALVIHGRRTPERYSRREWGTQILVGALSQAGYTVTVFWAIGLGVSTGTTALIDGIQPLVVAALAGPLLGAATRGHQWWGLLVGAVGVLVVTWTDATAATSSAPLWGYLVPLVGMGCLVAATFLERRSAPTMPPVQTLAVHCATSAVIFTVACLATGTATPPADLGFWLAMLWLIVLSTIGGYGLYWVMLRRVGVTSVNTLMFLMPPVTALWGTAMYGEPFTWTTALGLTMALGATWVVNRSPADESSTGRRSPQRTLTHYA